MEKSVTPGLESFFRALPFGLRITQGEATVFANDLAVQTMCDMPSEKALTRRSFEFRAGAEPCTATLFLDETEQLRREQALIRRAYFDELTGLPNRRLIEQSIAALIESSNTPFAVAFLDLDGFKHTNDFYGHGVGDALLVEMSRRIAAALRPSDMLARLGGDEFLVLLSPIRDSDDLRVLLNELSQLIGHPYYLDGNDIASTASIGASIYPKDGTSYSTLQSTADRAMYRSKAMGRGIVQLFDDSIKHSVIERTRLEQRLRLAIGDRRITCAYQPKVNLHNGEIYGVEVLMRWIDEDGATQPPGDFISLAIEIGLLDDLTFQLLEKTTACIDEINAAFGERTSISFNIAAQQAGNLSFMRQLITVIAATGLSSRFVLEITEEAFVAKSLFQELVLPLIRAIGAKVSIDDFGVGYSSLSALADITADEVKIDRSFITNIHQRPRNQNVLKAIEALSYSLGMDIVVEGVETIEELTYLRAHTGIRHAQGYHFSRPVILDEISCRQVSGARQAIALRNTSRSRRTAKSG